MIFEIVFDSEQIGYLTVINTGDIDSCDDILNKYEGTIEEVINGDNSELKELLEESIYINETINHMIYNLKLKSNQKHEIINQSILKEYDTSKFYVNPKEEKYKISLLNNCLTIPILKFNIHISKDSTNKKEHKNILLHCLSNQPSDYNCNKRLSKNIKDI